MKLSFSLTVKDDGGAERLLESIRAAGFMGVEPTFVPEGTLPAAADLRGSAERFRKLADQADLKIPSMRGGPGFWTTFASNDAEKRRAAVKLAEKAFEALAIMGGDTLLIVPGQWESHQTYGEVWSNALQTARLIAEAAEKAKIKVGLENVENRFLLSPREWMQFLDELGSPRARMYFDAGNVVYLKQGFPEQWIRQLGSKYITRIHLKDAAVGGLLTYLLEGAVDWPAVSGAIREIKYSDWVGIELDLPAHHAAGMLASQYLAAEAIMRGTLMTLHVGLLGMGMMGQMHANIILEFFPKVSIAAVCDTHAENLAKAKELAPQAAVLEDPDALIAADVDAIVLSTPGFTHADLTERAVLAGKHVFAEKPVMTTRDGCRRMVELAEKHPDRAIVINHELRYSSFYGKAKQLITAGEIGQPQLAWCKAFRGPFVKKVAIWIQDARYSGGAMVDVSSHHYDLLNWYVDGKPKRVCAFGGNDVNKVVNNPHEVIDHAAVSFEYDNGVRGSLSLCMFAPPGGDQLELGVAGDRGILQTRPSTGDILVWKRDSEKKEPAVHHIENPPNGRGNQAGWVEAHDGFFGAIETGRRALTDVRDCVDGTLLAIAAEEAILKGTVVEV